MDENDMMRLRARAQARAGADIRMPTVTAGQQAHMGTLLDSITNNPPASVSDLNDPATGKKLFMWGVDGVSRFDSWIIE